MVSSARADGRPHAAPSLLYRRGAEFWLPTVAGSVRERNVRAHPWLALTVTDLNPPAALSRGARG